MPTSINGGNFSGSNQTNLYHKIVSGFTGISCDYLYNTGNYFYRYNLINSGLDALLLQSGVEYYSYPFYRINPLNLKRNEAIYSGDNGSIVQNPASGIIMVPTGITTKLYANSVDNSTGHSISISPTVNSSLVSPALVINSFNPSDHLLVCYNSNSQDSIDIKNYYFQCRPELSSANILPLNCTGAISGDMTNMHNYLYNVRNPVINYLLTGRKPIRYCLFLYDIPMTMSGIDIGLSLFSPYYANYGYTDADYEFNLTGGAFWPPKHNPMLGYDIYSFFARTGYLRNNTGVNLDYNFQTSTTIDYYNDNTYIGPADINKYCLYKYGQSVLCSHISARNKQDVSGYISKVGSGQLYNNYFRKGNGRNTGYFFYTKSNPNGPFGELNLANNVDIFADATTGDYMFLYGKQMSGIIGGNTPKVIHVFGTHTGNKNGSPFTRISGRDMAGFCFHGIHTSDAWSSSQRQVNAWYALYGDVGYTQGDYNQVLFTGYNWYLMSSVESFNGHNYFMNGGNITEQSKIVGNQGTIFSWMSSGSFGGSGYSNCPIGMVGHYNEPGWIKNFPPIFYGMWHSGYPFIECAWASQGIYNRYVAHSYAVGDPLTVK